MPLKTAWLEVPGPNSDDWMLPHVREECQKYKVNLADSAVY